MAFIIPNATNIGGSEKFLVIDQSEPDSIDFEVLGNVGNSGVVSGCAVTLNNANTVNVSSGTVLINGSVYTVAATSSLTVAAPISSRFSLVVARLNTSTQTVSVVVVYGNDDATNPYFPNSVNTVLSTSGSEVDFDKDVVLASVYRISGQELSAKSIIDKRVIVKNVVSNQGTTAPPAGTGSVGEFYFSSSQTLGTNSGLYVKGSAGWIPVQQNVGPQLPVGAAIAWPSSASIPSGFLAANGQTLNRSQYPELAAAYGQTSATFTLPNLNDHVLKGTTTAANAGTSVPGSTDTTTLSTGNLPSHTHSLNNHTHGFAHTHNTSHTHSVTVGNAGSHFHDAKGYADVYDWMNYDWVQASPNNGFYVYRATNDASITTGDSRRWYFGWYGNAPTTSGFRAGFTNTEPSHTHTVNIGTTNAGTTSQSDSTTDISTTANTGTTGSGSSFTNIPKAAYVIWIIRVTTGDYFPAGTSIYEEAREEVVTVQLESGAISTGTGKAYYRMPWAATLTGVKANCNNNVTSLVTVDVNEGLTSVLSTKLTIDNGESSSLTATTPAVISDSDIANDALLTFDVDGGTGTGPLTVTLYFSRTT